MKSKSSWFSLPNSGTWQTSCCWILGLSSVATRWELLWPVWKAWTPSATASLTSFTSSRLLSSEIGNWLKKNPWTTRCTWRNSTILYRRAFLKSSTNSTFLSKKDCSFWSCLRVDPVQLTSHQPRNLDSSTQRSSMLWDPATMNFHRASDGREVISRVSRNQNS